MNQKKLKQKICGIEFKNPVLAASGTFGYGEEFLPFYDVSLIGGFVTKAITPEQRKGNIPPRIIETPSGMLNAIGLENCGLEFFTSDILPRISSFDTVIIVNVAGRTVEDYCIVCSKLDSAEKIRAFEINISCPNVKKEGLAFGSSPDTASSLVNELRSVTKKPLIVKLSPNTGDITRIARAVENAGADGVSLINTITGMVVNVETRRPMLGNVTGGLSGPAIRPIAVRMVYEVAHAVSIPVIGIGGIFCAQDALEFIIAGASLVEVGCGMFVKPRLPLEVIDGITDYLDRHNIDSISDLVGSIMTGGE